MYKRNSTLPVEDVSNHKGKAAKHYASMSGKRHNILERARRCCQLTLPALLTPDYSNESDVLTTPYQSLGARGVNTLASKLLLALFPPNTPFFKLSLSDKEALELQNQANQLGLAKGKSFLSSLEEAMTRYERILIKEAEKDSLRVPMFDTLKLCIATGNALLFVPKKGDVKVYSIEKYVIERDYSGNPIRWIVCETLTPKALPEEAYNSLSKKDQEKTEVSIFTYVLRKDKNTYEGWQELKNGTVIAGTEGEYKAEDMPWIPVRWSSIAGEHYGRGLVEEYLGDLNSLEAISKSIVQMAAVSSKILFMVNPNGTTKVRDLARKESGDFCVGNIQDVSTLQVQKANDFQVAYQTKVGLEEALSHAFLLNVAVRRQAERVTAEEIRYVAADLEDNLGGEYSVLSQTLQLPLIKALMARYASQNRLPDLPTGSVEPTIIAGLEALGRGYDYGKLKQFVGDVINLQAGSFINMPDLITRIGVSQGVEMAGLIKSEEQLQQERQAAMQQQQAMMQQQAVAQGTAGAAGKIAGELIKEEE
tara:strand:- start:643 stop:2247 length:1605 start_codon:yes stop_codon:yes gene_type:complete